MKTEYFNWPIWAAMSSVRAVFALAVVSSGCDSVHVRWHRVRQPFKPKKMKPIFRTVHLLLWLWAIPFVAQAQFIFTTNNGAITITSCTNTFDNDGTLVIPDMINDLPVVSIDYYACSYKSMTNVTIGNNVTNIGAHAFWACLNLHNVTIPKSVSSIGNYAFCGGGVLSIFFLGNPPVIDGGLCATLYYLPGATGWDEFLVTNNYSGKLWNPQPQTSDGSFGVISNRFGFNITGTPDIPVVVEARANLGSVWTPVQSVSLTNGSFYFSDPQWKSHSSRFYRIRPP
jgi:hypothetical protein